ncbi:MAG: hypothetical protein NT027_20540 [Proteobacteria bacterium]|nr:hypothetical protein [Pseudomonadota bacterium]
MVKYKKILVLTLVSLLTGMVIFYFAFPYYAQSEVVNQQLVKSDSEIHRHWEAFKEDYRIVQASLDWKTTRRNDAGQFLNSRIPWIDEADCHDCELNLKSDLLENIRSNEWPKLFGGNVAEGLNFSWLKHLEVYDHWDLFSALTERKVENILKSNISPQYTQLLYWARLRLLAAEKEVDYKQASAEIRHLAKLLNSQNILTSAVAAIEILNAEMQLKTHLEMVRDVRAASLPAFDSEFISRVRRIAWGSALLLKQSTPSETLFEFTHSNEFSLFRCLATTEALINQSYLPQVLRSAFLGDRDLIISAAIERETGTCQLGGFSSAKVLYSDDVQLTATLGSYLGPSWSRYFARTLFSLGAPNPFRYYEDSKE